MIALVVIFGLGVCSGVALAVVLLARAPPIDRRAVPEPALQSERL